MYTKLYGIVHDYTNIQGDAKKNDISLIRGRNVDFIYFINIFVDLTMVFN